MDEEMEKILAYIMTFFQAYDSHGFNHTARITRLCRRNGIREGGRNGSLHPCRSLP